MIARTTVVPFLFVWFYCQRIPKQPAFSLVTITFSPHVASHGIVNLRVIHLMSVSFHWSVQPLLVLKKRLHLRSKDWSSIKFIFHILLVILTNAELKKMTNWINRVWHAYLYSFLYERRSFHLFVQGCWTIFLMFLRRVT